MENVYLEDNYMTSDALQLYPDAGGGGCGGLSAVIVFRGMGWQLATGYNYSQGVVPNHASCKGLEWEIEKQVCLL